MQTYKQHSAAGWRVYEEDPELEFSLPLQGYKVLCVEASPIQ